MKKKLNLMNMLQNYGLIEVYSEYPNVKIVNFVSYCGGGCPVAAIEVNKDIDCPVCSDIEKTLQVYIDTIKNKILNQM